MKGIPQGRNTKELREEAVKMVIDGGLSLPEAARRLSLPPSTLANWIKAYKAGKLKDIGKNYRPFTELELKLAKVEKELAEHGVQARVCRIKRIRKKLGIRCKQKKFKATTDSKHAHPVADNLLNQQFETTAPGKIWTTDITYIPTDEGWLYLAGHKDLLPENSSGMQWVPG